MRGFVTLVTLLGSAGLGSPALAQSDTVVVHGSELDVMMPKRVEARITELERAYDSVNLAGPRAGVGTSAIVVAGGVTSIVMGAVLRNFETTFLCPPDDPRCGDPSAASAAIVGLGVAALIGGIVGVALSTRRLQGRKEEQRRIQWEIGRLRGSEEGPCQERRWR